MKYHLIDLIGYLKEIGVTKQPHQPQTHFGIVPVVFFEKERPCWKTSKYALKEAKGRIKRLSRLELQEMDLQWVWV